MNYHLIKSRHHERGSVLIWMAAFITVVIAMLALGVDLGFAYLISNELNTVADAGALTAANTFLRELRSEMQASGNLSGIDPATVHTAIQADVSQIVSRSQILNLGPSDDVTVEIQMGSYVYSTAPYDGTQFTDLTSGVLGAANGIQEINAFRVVTRRGDTPGNTWSYFFAKIFGLPNPVMERDAVSILNPRNFLLMVSTTDRMDDVTYYGGAPEGNENFIISAPVEGDTTTPWFSPNAPATSSPFPVYTPYFPEPLQSVLNKSLEFLQTELPWINIPDTAGVNYFAQGSANKVPMTLITAADVSGTFTSVLQNGLLYNNLIQSGLTPPDHYELGNGVAAYSGTTYQYDNAVAIPYGPNNLGYAIQQAISNLQASTVSSVQSFSVIILFVNDRPQCSGPATTNCYPEPMTSTQATDSLNFVQTQAQNALAQGILIYPISYGMLDASTVVLLDQIAADSGLATGHYQMGTLTTTGEIQAKLTEIFNDISLLIPFMLAG